MVVTDSQKQIERQSLFENCGVTKMARNNKTNLLIDSISCGWLFDFLFAAVVVVITSTWRDALLFVWNRYLGQTEWGVIVFAILFTIGALAFLVSVFVLLWFYESRMHKTHRNNYN